MPGFHGFVVAKVKTRPAGLFRAAGSPASLVTEQSLPAGFPAGPGPEPSRHARRGVCQGRLEVLTVSQVRRLAGNWMSAPWALPVPGLCGAALLRPHPFAADVDFHGRTARLACGVRGLRGRQRGGASSRRRGGRRFAAPPSSGCAAVLGRGHRRRLVSPARHGRVRLP